MNTAFNPHEHCKTLPGHLPSLPPEVMAWIVDADDEAVSRRVVDLEKEQATIIAKAEPIEKLEVAFGLLAALAGFALSVQFFGRGLALQNPMGFPDLWVTVLVFSIFLAVKWWLGKMFGSRREVIAGQLAELIPLTNKEFEELKDWTEKSSCAGDWCEYASTVARRKLRRADLSIAKATFRQEAKRTDTQSACHRDLYAFRAADNQHTLVEPTELVRIATRGKEPYTSEELQVLMAATDEDVDGWVTQNNREFDLLLSAHARRRKWGDIGFWSLNGLWLLVSGFLWSVVTLQRPPMWVCMVSIMGGAITLAGLALVQYALFSSDKGYEAALHRKYQLNPLTMGDEQLLLKWVQKSALARAWHHQIVSVSQRQFRQQDLRVVLTLMSREKPSE